MYVLLLVVRSLHVSRDGPGTIACRGRRRSEKRQT